MNEIKKGDNVTRNSYNNDVILLLGKINNNVKEALRLNEIEIIKRLTK